MNNNDILNERLRLMLSGEPEPEPNMELAAAVHAQVQSIMRANRWKGSIKPPYGKKEELPTHELTYDEAVERARAGCRHSLAVRMELAEWYCPQCRRRLDLNDVGAGGV